MSAWLSIQMCLEFAFVGSMETNEFSSLILYFLLKREQKSKAGVVGDCGGEFGCGGCIFWGSDN